MWSQISTSLCEDTGWHPDHLLSARLKSREARTANGRWAADEKDPRLRTPRSHLRHGAASAAPAAPARRSRRSSASWHVRSTWPRSWDGARGEAAREVALRTETAKAGGEKAQAERRVLCIERVSVTRPSRVPAAARARTPSRGPLRTGHRDARRTDAGRGHHSAHAWRGADDRAPALCRPFPVGRAVRAARRHRGRVASRRASHLCSSVPLPALLLCAARTRFAYGAGSLHPGSTSARRYRGSVLRVRTLCRGW